MKTVKLLVTIFALFFLSNVFAWDNDISIIDIDTNSTSVIKLFFDKDIDTNAPSITSDLKVFRDLDTSKVEWNLENNKLVNITLINELETNSSYSLLSVLWTEWTIDFSIEDVLNWLEIKWSDTDLIEKIMVINSTNLEVYFKNIIEAEVVDIKLLKEHNVDSLKISLENKKELDVYLKNDLLSDSKFIIMMFNFETKENLEFSVLNSIYDFKTESLNNENIEVPVDEIIVDDEKVDNVALNSAQTPDTWAETWIILLFTFIVSNFIYFRKKFIK